jgi:hypothetical protein
MTDVSVPEPVQSFDKPAIGSHGKDSPLHEQFLRSLQAKFPRQHRIAPDPSELSFPDPYKHHEDRHHEDKHHKGLHESDSGSGGPASTHAGDHDANRLNRSQFHPHDSAISDPPLHFHPTQAEIRQMMQAWNQVIVLPNGEKAHVK